MTHAQPGRRLVGHLTMTLHRDHFVGGLARRGLEVRAQLVERATAHTACAAVLEKQNRPLIRFRDCRLELVDVRKWFQWCHRELSIVPCNRRAVRARPSRSSKKK